MGFFDYLKSVFNYKVSVPAIRVIYAIAELHYH